MKKIHLVIGTVLSTLLASSAFAASNSDQAKKLKDVAPYPAVSQNQNRHVIWLDKQKNEELYKVEIVATQKGMKDCNNTWFSAELDTKNLEGWGYTYYNIEQVKGPMSTMRGCLDNKKTETNLPVNLGDDALVRYNSKLPVVVYAPKDVQISYRIWQAPEKAKASIIVND